MLLLRDGNLLLVKKPQAKAVATLDSANRERERVYARLHEEFFEQGIDREAIRATRARFRVTKSKMGKWSESKVELLEHKQEPSDPHSVLLPPLPRLAVLPLPQGIGQPALVAAKELVRTLERSLREASILAEKSKAVVYYNDISSLHLTVFQNSRVGEPRAATQTQIAAEREAWGQISRAATEGRNINLEVHSICITTSGQVLLLLQGVESTEDGGGGEEEGGKGEEQEEVKETEEEKQCDEEKEDEEGDGDKMHAVLSAPAELPRANSVSALLASDSSSECSAPPPGNDHPPPPPAAGIFSPTHPASPSSPETSYRKTTVCHFADRHPLDQMRHLAQVKFSDAPNNQSVLFHVTLARIVGLPLAAEAEGASQGSRVAIETTLDSLEEAAPAASVAPAVGDSDASGLEAAKLSEEHIEPFRRKCSELSEGLKSKRAAVGCIWYIEEKFDLSATGARKVIDFLQNEDVKQGVCSA
jgi:hypothetical protein